MSTSTFSNFFGTNASPSFSTLKNMSDLSPAVQKHLIKVYTNLSLMMLTATLGSYAFLNGIIANVGLFIFTSIVSMLALSFLSYESKALRISMLHLFSFSKGVVLGPLLLNTMYLHPGVITTALFTTVIVFMSFTLTALLSKRRSYLYLGGIISATTLSLCILSLFNAFAQSNSVDTLNLYLGVVLFSSYIIYDTQIIVEKASRGHADVIQDCMNLFINFISLFVRLIIILRKNQEKKEREDRERRSRY